MDIDDLAMREVERRNSPKKKPATAKAIREKKRLARAESRKRVAARIEAAKQQRIAAQAHRIERIEKWKPLLSLLKSRLILPDCESKALQDFYRRLFVAEFYAGVNILDAVGRGLKEFERLGRYLYPGRSREQWAELASEGML